MDAAGEAVSGIIAAGIVPAAIEMMDKLTISACEAATHAGYPLDAGAILIPGTQAREPIDELELEWKPAAGSTLAEDAIAERLHAWTQKLRAAVPGLTPLDISKAQRGYQLRTKATGGQP